VILRVNIASLLLSNNEKKPQQQQQKSGVHEVGLLVVLDVSGSMGSRVREIVTNVLPNVASLVSSADPPFSSPPPCLLVLTTLSNILLRILIFISNSISCTYSLRTAWVFEPRQHRPRLLREQHTARYSHHPGPSLFASQSWWRNLRKSLRIARNSKKAVIVAHSYMFGRWLQR